MALKSSNFYKFIFDGGQEYTVTHESEEIKSVISAVSDGLLNLDILNFSIKRVNLFMLRKIDCSRFRSYHQKQ